MLDFLEVNHENIRTMDNISSTQEINANTINNLPYQDITHLPIKKGIDPEVVCTLKDKGYTFPQIAKILKISKYTAFYHYHRLRPDKETTKYFVDNRAEVFQEVQKRLLLSINDEDIKKTPVGSRVLAAAQLYDKERLETDQSTSNQAVSIGVAPALRSSLNGLSKRLSGRMQAGSRDKVDKEPVRSLPNEDNLSDNDADS